MTAESRFFISIDTRFPSCLIIISIVLKVLNSDYLFASEELFRIRTNFFYVKFQETFVTIQDDQKISKDFSENIQSLQKTEKLWKTNPSLKSFPKARKIPNVLFCTTNITWRSHKHKLLDHQTHRHFCHRFFTAGVLSLTILIWQRTGTCRADKTRFSRRFSCLCNFSANLE